MLYQRRQGEDACHEFANRHYGSETRKMLICSKDGSHSSPLYIQQRAIDRNMCNPGKVPTSILCGVYTACMLGLGLRIMVAVYSYAVQEDPTHG